MTESKSRSSHRNLFLNENLTEDLVNHQGDGYGWVAGAFFVAQWKIECGCKTIIVRVSRPL